jgi:hypothetical protein
MYPLESENLVQRVEMSGGLDDFEGVVDSVELEAGIDDRRQYHVRINPTSFKVKGPTQQVHEWIPMSPRSTEEAVPQGSVVDRYLMQLEIALPEVKAVAKVGDALKRMEGKKFHFKRLKLGKDFDGKKAKDYIVPVGLVK